MPNLLKLVTNSWVKLIILTADTGFNTPNSSWMFGLKFKDTDDNILLNDAVVQWGLLCVLK